MNTNPKVSVVIPTYNYAHLLDETIQCVLAQTFTDFELVIVDNCSNDNTAEVVNKYLTDNRVSFYRNDRNLGLTGNWNRCLELAKGEYIKYLCADDKFHPQLLERFVPVMDQNPGLSIVSCQKQWFGDNVPNKVITLPVSGLQNGRLTIFNMMKYYNFLGEPSLPMFRKKHLFVGPFKEFSFITDWEMWVRLLTVGDCYIIPEILCYVRQHNSRQTVMCKKNLINRAEEYYLYKDIQNNKYGVSFPEHKEEIDALVKMKAIKCSKEMYKLLYRIPKKENLELMKKMYKIAAEEKVVFDLSILRNSIRKKRKKVSN